MALEPTKPEVCSCGRSYTAQEYLALPAPLGGSTMLGCDENDQDITLHLRNCVCGSTMARPLTPAKGS